MEVISLAAGAVALTAIIAATTVVGFIIGERQSRHRAVSDVKSVKEEISQAAGQIAEVHNKQASELLKMGERIDIIEERVAATQMHAQASSVANKRPWAQARPGAKTEG